MKILSLIQRWAVPTVLASCVAAAPVSAQCINEWSTLGTGTTNGVNSTISSIATIDGALYVGGASITSAGGVPAVGIAKWDGATWSALGAGVSGVNAIAEWNGDIYVGGTFTDAGGNPASRIAKWNGSEWSALALGANDIVNAVTVYNNELYIGGNFTEVDFTAGTSRIAKWNGTNWSPVGTGITASRVNEMVVYNGELYVRATGMTAAGGVAVPDELAKWDGTNWSAVPSGFDAPADGDVIKLIGTNGNLYASVSYSTLRTSRVWRLDGAAWTTVVDMPWATGGSSSGFINDIEYFDAGDGTGLSLYVAGRFFVTGGPIESYIARWDGSAWVPVGGGTNNSIHHLITYNSGLYATGSYANVDYLGTQLAAARIARWGCNPSGACCLPSGVCEVRTQASCERDSGTYQGDSIACGGVTCIPAPTGRCCFTNGTCTVTYMNGPGGCLVQNGAYQGDGTTCAGACPLFETESNNAKSSANAVTLSPGQQIGGITTTSSSAGLDYFLVKTTPAPLSIYRHRLVFTSATLTQSITLRGLSTSGGVPPGEGAWPCELATAVPNSDATIEAHWLDGTDRIVSWYGFGKEESVYVRVTGVSGSTAPYVATLETTTDTAVDIGEFAEGTIIITNALFPQRGTDISVAIFNANFEPVPGYANTEATLDSGTPITTNSEAYLQRTYQPGTYYLAIFVGTGATSSPRPCDHTEGSGTFNVPDFPDVVIPGITVPQNQSFPADVTFEVIDAAGSHVFPASTTERDETGWFRFTVVGDCPADFNGVNGVTVQDIFDFLTAWLAGSSSADFNTVNGVTVQDIFDFLTAWLAGC